MKKIIISTVAIIIAIVLFLGTHFLIWGEKPKIKNFDELSNDYEAIVKLAFNYYENLSYKDENIIIIISNNELKHENNTLLLSSEQKLIVKNLEEKFNFLRVYKDAVFFCEDETHYYGLVYSKHPIIALYKAKLPQHGREYHRINSNWYEWGCFGW